jgi:hypothetical protein
MDDNCAAKGGATAGYERLKMSAQKEMLRTIEVIWVLPYNKDVGE